MKITSFSSVIVPDMGTTERLPVVVWIHGGGYGYYLPTVVVFFIDRSSEGMIQAVLRRILKETWLPFRKIE
jgi:hypothetical protein